MNLSAEWLRLSIALGLDLKGMPVEKQKQTIRQALAEKENWLIVLDNLENKEALESLLPAQLSPTQQVLITTRSRDWGAHPVHRLGPFTPEESEAYFLKHVPQYELRQIKQLFFCKFKNLNSFSSLLFFYCIDK